jgi:hypothetical protein
VPAFAALTLVKPAKVSSFGARSGMPGSIDRAVASHRDQVGASRSRFVHSMDQWIVQEIGGALNSLSWPCQ